MLHDTNQISPNEIGIGTYPTRDDAAAHAAKHARNTHGQEIAGWKPGEAGEEGKTTGEPPVRYLIAESTS